MSEREIMKGGKYNAVQFYRLSNFFYRKKLVFLSRLVDALMYQCFNCIIPSRCQIGEGTFCSHRGIGVVIHPQSKVGRDVTIGTSVVLGGLNGHNNQDGGPTIGDDVYIGTGAKILGPITIGKNVKIGANAVVLKDVPDNATVVGIPAKVIRINE